MVLLSQSEPPIHQQLSYLPFFPNREREKLLSAGHSGLVLIDAWIPDLDVQSARLAQVQNVANPAPFQINVSTL